MNLTVRMRAQKKMNEPFPTTIFYDERLHKAAEKISTQSRLHQTGEKQTKAIQGGGGMRERVIHKRQTII
jgi:hypothetical protein